MVGSDSDDVIDLANWIIVRDMVIAAHEGNYIAFRAACFRLDRDVPVDEKAGMYVAYLLWRRVSDLLCHKPAAEDFRDIADRAYSREPNIFAFDKQDLENTVRTVFSQTDEGNKVAGVRLIIAGTAILSALFDELPAEFDAMYRYLDDWYRRTFT